MSNEEQGAAFKNNSSSETGDSAPDTEPLNIEGTQPTNGLKSPVIPSDSGVSDGHMKYAKSAEDLQTSQTDKIAGLHRISGDNAQPPIEDNIPDTAKADVSVNGNQPSNGLESTGKSIEDKQSPQDNQSPEDNNVRC